MRCHWCDREAIYAAESNGVRVGLCERHLSERVEELSEADALIDLQDRVES